MKTPFQKRILDIVLTLPGLLLISPIIIIIIILLLIYQGRPIFFEQKRPGFRNKIFTLRKFRSMRDLTDTSGNLLPDSERITPIGKFLRTTSLDELPELINVLRGEMSLVGPRPLLVQYLERYSSEQARRHHVLPGITGWAQINGRNTLSWEDKFKMDVWYVDNWSIWLDIKILAITVWKVIKREGISQPGQSTAIEFMGSDSSEQNNDFFLD
ncbi:MAG: sugar transferase [Anaerolineaceae bacterium]|nr:sugar transferase [Anaerolineaceae bacterium]